MPSRFVRQPDGKRAVCSAVVDAFTLFDLTEKEAMEWCRITGLLGPKSSKHKVRAGLEDRPLWSTKPLSGFSRWVEALETIVNVHGLASSEWAEAKKRRCP